jgi:RND family efflux transporter MFP subunit
MTTWVSALSSALAVALAIAACGAGAENAGAPPVAIRVGYEDVVEVVRDTIVTGPVVSGELRAQQEAAVRAEIGGSVIRVAVEEGQPVKKGMVLARIEAVALSDARRSAATAVRSSDGQLVLARREVERTEQLVNAGAQAPRDLDQARTAVGQAEAQLADAQARLAAAEKQLENANLRAPFDGIVSRRAVSNGDVVAPGSEMFTIIDPRSMRLAASVPSAQLGSLHVGLPVRFTVRGYPKAFEGRIERIGPAADPTTRQVPILASLPNADRRLVSGLFAEGRVVAGEANGLVAPDDAVNTTTATPWVVRVNRGTTEKIEVTLGLRDPLTERVQILTGVGEGDLLLRGPAQAIPPNTPVQLPAVE